MMKFIRLVLSNLRIILHQPSKILSFLLLPIFVIFILNMGFSASSVGSTVIHFMNEDSLLLNEIRKNNIADIAIDNEDKIVNNLSRGKITTAYFIPDDYEGLLEAGKNPQIIIKSNVKNGYDIRIERYLNEYKNKIIVDKKLAEYGVATINNMINDPIINITDNGKIIDTKYFTAILMIMLFIMINSNQLIMDLLNLKKNNVLKRMITTPNNDLFHMFSILIANLIIMTVLNISAVFLASKFMGFKINSYPMMIAVISSMCFVSTTMSLAIFRLFKSEVFISVIPILVASGSGFMVMFLK